MDRIRVRNIRGYGYTGFLPEEQVLGQWFQVDLTIDLDLKPSGNSDDLMETLDYSKAVLITKSLIEDKKYALVEKLAAEIAKEILSFDLVRQVRVELTKLAAPIPGFDGEITIDITRTKS